MLDTVFPLISSVAYFISLVEIACFPALFCRSNKLFTASPHTTLELAVCHSCRVFCCDHLNFTFVVFACNLLF